VPFSVNVPVPPAVRRLADDLAPELAAYDSVRDDFTLVLKRLGNPDSFPATEKRVRGALRGAPAFEARVSEVGAFRNPPVGKAPVVYLAVEGPGIGELHERLCDAFGPVAGMEGEDYVPHVTLARGHTPGPLGRDPTASLVGRSVGPVRWDVTELQVRDGIYGETTARVSLPA
jgi:2'-5' RNA ligase